MSIAFILVIVLTIIRLWIALQLFLTAKKSNLNNLYWLAGLFFLALYTLFATTNQSPLSNRTIFQLGFIAGHFCLAMFIHTTFYRDRKSPVYILLALVVLAFLLAIYGLFTDNSNLLAIATSVGLINWGWHLVVARSAYSKIAADPSVENWVKSRYKLMIAYIVLMILATAQVVASNTAFASSIPSIVVPIVLLVVIASVILQFLVWVMPEPFRQWLNRKPQPRPIPVPVNEEQLPRSILDVFGAAMTDGTGLQNMVCFYAIRSTIAKQIGTENSYKIQQRINTMTYYDWDTTLQHAELNRILINGGANKNVAAKAVENARQALVEKQSLLTLSTR